MVVSEEADKNLKETTSLPQLNSDQMTSQPRVPVALQQIFLRSLGGDDLTKISAPKNGLGFKIFGRFGGRNKISKPHRSSIANKSSSVSSSRSGSTETFRRPSAAEASIQAMKERNTELELDCKTVQESEITPQAFLDKALIARGHATRKYGSLEGGYFCRPTPLQDASYGTRVCMAIRSNDASTLRRMLNCGLSPNPCNAYGESLIHMVCRRGNYELLNLMIECGSSLQVTDDYGRTPLHDACWGAQPNFKAIKLILTVDKNLVHMLDCRGAPPLSYVSKENFGPWIDFLKENLDEIWPPNDLGMDGGDSHPPLTLQEPDSVPIPDPVHALPLEVATLVANGIMEPEEAIFLDDYSSDDDDDAIEFSCEESSSSSDYDSDNESDELGFDTEEMAELCLRAGGPQAVA